MNHEMETAKNEELTLLALGEKFALVGDGGGLVRRACLHCLNRIKTVQPRRVYLDEDAERDIFGFKIRVSEDIPLDFLMAFQTVRDFSTGLGVSACFDPKGKTWYVSEVLDPITGKGSGRFFFTEADALTFATL